MTLLPGRVRPLRAGDRVLIRDQPEQCLSPRPLRHGPPATVQFPVGEPDGDGDQFWVVQLADGRNEAFWQSELILLVEDPAEGLAEEDEAP